MYEKKYFPMVIIFVFLFWLVSIGLVSNKRFYPIQRDLEAIRAERDKLAEHVAELDGFNKRSLERVGELKQQYIESVEHARKVQDSSVRLGKLLGAISTLSQEYESIIRGYGRAIAGSE